MLNVWKDLDGKDAMVVAAVVVGWFTIHYIHFFFSFQSTSKEHEELRKEFSHHDGAFLARILEDRRAQGRVKRESL